MCVCVCVFVGQEIFACVFVDLETTHVQGTELNNNLCSHALRSAMMRRTTLKASCSCDLLVFFFFAPESVNVEAFVLTWLLVPGLCGRGARGPAQVSLSWCTVLVHGPTVYVVFQLVCVCVCVLVEKGNEASCEKWSRSLSFLLT